MLLLLATLFIGLPVLEIYLLIEVGEVAGALPTIGLCVLTGVVGAWLARGQGSLAMQRAQHKLERGELPTTEALDGAMILIAGVVLMTPGFVTDALGLLLLLPPTRAIARVYAIRWLRGRMQQQRRTRAQLFTHFGAEPPPWANPRQPRPSGRRPDRQDQPDVEFLPPDVAPRPPARKRPPVIDVD